MCAPNASRTLTLLKKQCHSHGTSEDSDTVKLLNNGPPKEQPLVNNGQILIALAYFNTFATLKGGHP